MALANTIFPWSAVPLTLGWLSSASFLILLPCGYARATLKPGMADGGCNPKLPKSMLRFSSAFVHAKPMWRCPVYVVALFLCTLALEARRALRSVRSWVLPHIPVTLAWSLTRPRVIC